jgi:hypothetical protein
MLTHGNGFKRAIQRRKFGPIIHWAADCVPHLLDRRAQSLTTDFTDFTDVRPAVSYPCHPYCYLEKLCYFNKIFGQDEQDEQNSEMADQEVFIL